jgi:hypothetical protein
MDSSLASYLPQDHRHALLREEELPEHTSGAALALKSADSIV